MTDEGKARARERLDWLRKQGGYTAFKAGPGGKWRGHEPPAVIDAFVERAYLMREWVGPDVELAFDFHGKMTPALAIEICHEPGEISSAASVAVAASAAPITRSVLVTLPPGLCQIRSSLSGERDNPRGLFWHAPHKNSRPVPRRTGNLQRYAVRALLRDDARAGGSHDA